MTQLPINIIGIDGEKLYFSRADLLTAFIFKKTNIHHGALLDRNAHFVKKAELPRGKFIVTVAWKGKQHFSEEWEVTDKIPCERLSIPIKLTGDVMMHVIAIWDPEGSNYTFDKVSITEFIPFSFSPRCYSPEGHTMVADKKSSPRIVKNRRSAK